MPQVIDFSAILSARFKGSAQVKEAIASDPISIATLAQIVHLFVETYEKGGKILFCGNGGSAADAQHLVAELVVRLRSSFNRAPLAALSLAMDSSSMTASGNDYGYETHFERMVDAIGQKGDVLVGMTTSGRSENIIRALRRARERGIGTVGFLGQGGGPALSECDLAFVVPSDDTARCQEAHMTAGHSVIELLEDTLEQKGLITRL